MAKSDLLKEAIADARAVKETALANAKIALQEAYAPRIQRMISDQIENELDSEEEKSLIIDKISNLTIEEMAKKRNSNRETTRKKLNKVIEKVKKSFVSCV